MIEGAGRESLPAQIGRYDVVGHIATGGMAELYLGVDPQSAKPVAIKRILPHLARQASFVSMFLDEARIGSTVRHRSLADVYELGQVGGDLFLVMEYLEGENLASIIRRYIKRGEQMPYALAAHVIREAAIALSAAHSQLDDTGAALGIVHRDVSPQNVFVTYGGDVKVLDFGIAMAAERLARTEAGQLKGKFPYMSPEQSRGDRLDARSDIFSLGIVLYELTTQHTLFRRPSELMVLKAVCEEPIPRPSRDRPEYPKRLEDACLKALARDLSRRWSSMDDFASELAAVADLDEPGALLREEMARLFEDRRAEKARMLRSARSRSNFEAMGTMPSVEADESVDLPQISVLEATPSGMRTVSERGGRRWKVAAGVGVAALAIVGGIAWFSQGDEALPAASVAPPAPAIAAPVVVLAPLPPAPPHTAVVHVATTPAGATVIADGVDLGTTPLDHAFAHGVVHVELRRAGYAPLAQDVLVERDQRLLLSLTPIQAPAPRPAPKTPPRAFHRFQ